MHSKLRAAGLIPRSTGSRRIDRIDRGPCPRGGDGRRAAVLLGYVDARFTELGIKREHTEQWGYDKLIAALRETLKEDEIAQLSAEGAAWSEDRAVEEALQV